MNDNSERYKKILEEIKALAKVTPVTACWTMLEFCERCDNKYECEDQSPFRKLAAIRKIIHENNI